MSHTITGIQIDHFRLKVLQGMLKLECLGLRFRRGTSAYAILKRELGLKGSKENVLKQVTEMLATSQTGAA